MFINENHPSFLDKPNAEAKVWRYMDLARYVSFLEDGALHFASAEHVNDRWEGALSDVNKALAIPFFGGDYESVSAKLNGIRRIQMQRIHMSCWHLGEYESTAMWETYQREGRGVAIRSTWASLTSSLKSDRSIFGACVKYGDYSKMLMPDRTVFDPFMHKRLNFSSEQEVRLIMMTGTWEPDLVPPERITNMRAEPPIISIPVDVPELVHEVLVAPSAPTWVVDVFTKITRRYGYDFPVNQSDIARDPNK